MNIAGREIGHSHPPYMVAELSCNHSGSITNAKSLIFLAKESGADAVKLQTYTPAELTDDPELTKLYEKAQTPREWHADLFNFARRIGITIFSTPFSVDGVRFLESLGCPAYKIASPEIHDKALIEAACATGKPVIISSGMATEEDIKALPLHDIVVLHCVAQYPSRIEDANLNAMRRIRKYRPVGLSDHTQGYETAIAATVLGACVIEKHFKIDDDCIDAPYSLNPEQFGEMCRAVRAIHKGMGTGEIRPTCQPRKRSTTGSQPSEMNIPSATAA